MTGNQTASFTIRSATGNDLAAIKGLLAASDLPIEGVEEALCGFLVAEAADRLVGVVGMESCGEYGLLRSTAVAQEWRGHGIAKRLVERIVADAESQNISALYLLTTTAETYFPSFGFRVTPRDGAPTEIRATSEFRDACPASATLMCLSLSS
jgi:N-acetylglutamate synthase-like GNAT family acetyltransferase